MKVLVLGGTGAMGSHLIQLLSDDGVETVVTSRTAHNPVGNIRYIKGDASSLEFLKSILTEKWDTIVDFMVYSTISFQERVNLLLDATSQYIFLSSARVYADSQQPITENSPRLLDVSQDAEFLSTDEYSLTKARQENILLKSGRKNWTIIRPYITYSETRLQLGVLEKEEWLYRALHGRTIVFSKDIDSRKTTLTYGLDVSRGIFATIGVPSAFGEVFHITKSDPNTWHEILTIYLKVLSGYLGDQPKVLLQDIDKFLEIKPAKYQVLYDRLLNRSFDSSKIDRYISINNFISIEAGLENCLKEFLKSPVFGEIDWKIEAKKDKQTGEYTPLKEIPSIKYKVKYLAFRFFL